MWQREKRRGVQVVQGCSCVNVVDEGAEKGGVAQTGAIKMQIISFRAAIFPEEAGARNPTPSPINLELIYDDGDDDDDDSVVGKRRETAFCLAADRVNTGLTSFASVSRGLFLRFEHDSRHRGIKDKTFVCFQKWMESFVVRWKITVVPLFEDRAALSLLIKLKLNQIV